MALDSIIDLSITTTGAAPSRENFGTTLIAAYHTLWDARFRVYASTQSMLTDGFTAEMPAYQMASKIFSQSPRPKQVVVARRALAFSHEVVLTPATPAADMVFSVDVNGNTAAYTAVSGDDLADVCTALAAALNAESGVDADAIHDGGSTTGVQTIAAASLNGAIGDDVMAPARSLALTLSAHADWDATTVVVTGKNERGVTITEDFIVPNGGGTTVAGTKLFKQVTQLVVPAQSGTGGTFELGVQARFAAVSSGTAVTVTATDDGKLTSFAELSDTLSILDATADPGIATDLADILDATEDWYGLVLDSNSEAQVLEAAEWTEANRRLFGYQTADSVVLDPDSTDDVMYNVKAANYFRTISCYHHEIGTATSWFAAAWQGDRFPDNPGTDTWAFKTLAGITTSDLTETELAAILDKNGNAYVEVAGLSITYAERDGRGAKTAGGEWIDVVRGLDALRSNQQRRLFFLFTSSRKVAFTDAGIDMVRNQILASLAEFTGTDQAPGLLAADPEPVVTVPKAADVSAIDKANRFLPGVEWSATLSGAIHAMQIFGTVGSGGT